MENYTVKDVVAMLAVLYKRIEDLEHKIKGGFRSAPMDSYLSELKREANKITH
jgi:hypothetical protein